MCPIDFEQWWPRYQAIIQKFGYDLEEDQRAADLLSSLLGNYALNTTELHSLIANQNVVVCGAGPSLPQNLNLAQTYEILNQAILISANGATTALLEHNLIPTVVVTDLDGKISDILAAQRQDSIIVVHAHGDNILSLETNIPRLLEGKILGTTQAQPRPSVFNFGGFTDGDRCVFLAEAFAARTIALLGMDFGDLIGRYSKPNLIQDTPGSSEKRAKLLVAKDLLEWLATWSQSQLVNLTGGKISIQGIPDHSITEFEWDSGKD